MELISVSEAAKRWGVSARSARNYCALGRVPGAQRVGRTWGIPADAKKPLRASKRREAASPLVERLQREKAAKVKGGIYHKVQVELTYSSNRIEGSRLSLDQTRLIFETATIGAEDGSVMVDDVVEASNHFRAIDYVVDNADRPLSATMLKDLHRIVKAATTDAAKEWFAVGDYKLLPNEVAGMETTAPEDVAEEVAALVEAYEPRRSHGFDQIVDFHVRLERIHPFQDGNGRVGRLVMFKECLASGIVPFIIADDMKAFYYRGLSEWDRERGYLLDTCRAAQDRFKAALDRFRIPYEED